MSANEQLVLEIRRSKQLVFLVTLIHLLGAFSLLSLKATVAIDVAVLLLIVLSLFYYLDKSHQVVRVVALADNEWLIEKFDGSGFNATLRGNTYISNVMTLLVFSSLKKTSPTCVCLMQDSVTTQALSQLKLRLKVSAEQVVD